MPRKRKKCISEGPWHPYDHVLYIINKGGDNHVYINERCYCIIPDAWYKATPNWYQQVIDSKALAAGYVKEVYWMLTGEVLKEEQQ